MENINYKFPERIYLPSNDKINIKDYLYRYIEREFPKNKENQSHVYSIPKDFQKNGEKQATLAEKTVFNKLKGLQEKQINSGELFVIFFHGACYAGHSFRNQRVGKLMIREHDFVVFVIYEGKYYVILLEVKSTCDLTNKKENLEKSSDAKVIKNNKRSAQHQLRDHLEVLESVIEVDSSDKQIQSYIMWPFLSHLTKDPKQQITARWKEDKDLHVFENIISSQEYFNKWFWETILTKQGCLEQHFTTLLERFIILSCGVFVNEIDENLLALLTQEQLQLLNNEHCKSRKGPLIVHGAAGTGKTLLVLKKLEELYLEGRLNEENRALYICYWPGIRCDMNIKLEKLGIRKYVDTSRFFITSTDFLKNNKNKYTHIFMDESEAICLSFDVQVINSTLTAIYNTYHDGNCSTTDCKYSEPDPNLTLSENIAAHEENNWGELWFMVDINQASLFLPKYSPQLLKRPSITLSKIMRTTGFIFNVFKQFYTKPMPMLPKSLMANVRIPNIEIGHSINGPPIYWLDNNDSIDEITANLVIDLCSTKGFKPNDLCVLPFVVNEKFVPECINAHIDKHFVENGFRPRGIKDVESYLENKAPNDFLITWALRVKGLEFKVVIMAIEDDDFDTSDAEDRKKAYIIASRCTCMLIVISNQQIRNILQLSNISEQYPFNLTFNCNDNTQSIYKKSIM